ncbi:MAG: dephospho-CoA kinase [Spirochaetes bacterium]|jgi:dephospho-CoA kinase|nr:dephospho-CoA kinase [Spirochaetota bacterium]
MRVGVTGIYASGKGIVCGLFGELGAHVIDTDILAREITEPGTGALEKIKSEFGTAFIKSDGTLDRRGLANHVFKSPELVKRLNQITHPAIMEAVLKASAGEGIFMVNTPLLFESGFDRIMEINIVVTAGTEQILERGIKRDDITEGEILERLRHQISLNEKIKMADYVIDNSGSLENTKRQVIAIWKILKPPRKG